jgi:hypothetical protein
MRNHICSVINAVWSVYRVASTLRCRPAQFALVLWLLSQTPGGSSAADKQPSGQDPRRAAYVSISPDGRWVGVLLRGAGRSSDDKELWVLENQERALPRLLGVARSANFVWTWDSAAVVAVESRERKLCFTRWPLRDGRRDSSKPLSLRRAAAISIAADGTAYLLGKSRSGGDVVVSWSPGRSAFTTYRAPDRLSILLETPLCTQESEGRLSVISADHTKLLGLRVSDGTWWLACFAGMDRLFHQLPRWEWQPANSKAAWKAAEGSWAVSASLFENYFVGDTSGRFLALAWSEMGYAIHTPEGLRATHTDTLLQRLNLADQTFFDRRHEWVIPDFRRRVEQISRVSCSQDQETALLIYAWTIPENLLDGRKKLHPAIYLAGKSDRKGYLELKDKPALEPEEAALAPDAQSFALVLQRQGDVGIAIVALDGKVVRFWPIPR